MTEGDPFSPYKEEGRMFTPLNACPARPVKSFLYLTGVKCPAYLTGVYPVESKAYSIRVYPVEAEGYSIRAKLIYLGIIIIEADYS